MSINDRSQMGGAGGSGGGKILVTDRPNKTGWKGTPSSPRDHEDARAVVGCGTEIPYTPGRT